MPLMEMPDGTLAEIADGTPPDVIARIKAQHMPTRQGMGADADVSTPTPGQFHFDTGNITGSAMDLLRDASNPALMALRGISPAAAQGFENGATFNLNDEMRGGATALLHGLPSAAMNLDPSIIASDYTGARDQVRDTSRRFAEESPVASSVGEIAGALANPMGAGGDALRIGARVLPRLGRAADFLEAGPVRQAIATGVNQGALNGFGSSENDPLGGTLEGAALGGAFGGAAGGLAHGVRRGFQAIRDSAPENAGRAAYARIANLLNNAHMTPADAQRELDLTRAGGGRPMVADLTSGTQALAAHSARRAEMPGAADLRTASLMRTADRPETLHNQIAGHFDDVSTGTDAIALREANTGARKAHGNASYGDVLDRDFVWNDHLDDFVHGAGPSTKAALKRGADLLRDERLDPAQLGYQFNAAGDVEYLRVPNMRVFDYVKRGFDDEIKTALKAGDNNRARVLSDEIGRLKEGIGRSNPDYADVLATQRDFYQKDFAITKGQEIVSRLTGTRSDPRVLLNELKAIKPDDLDHVRSGFADTLLNLRDQGGKGRGVTVLRDMLSSPNKRLVLERLFDGKGNLGRFERWFNREIRAAETDAKISGPQSITSEIGLATEGGQADPFSEVAQAALRGYGFGGTPGLISNAIAGVKKLRPTERRPGFEAMARLLMSDGNGLAAGLRSTQEFERLRRAMNILRARQFAKAGQQPVTDLAGERR